MRGVGLDLSPQTQNLDVDRTVINVIVEPARFQKLVSGQHMPRRSEKRVQQAELAVGQLDSGTCRIGQLSGADIEFPPCKPIGPRIGGSSDRRRHRTGASEQRTHTCQQLTRTERLGQIVVRTQFEGHHAVGFIAFARDDHDGKV